ncbi:phosphatidate cytidylyltransferase [Vibrio sp. WXL103]|uniref:phosphatidate cytidylyltransferase n=1 Tax=Vibrio sp. WXL103 TaxID=3450710 RepID=UPI003EC61918
MKQRIITALILAPLVILGIFFLPLGFFVSAITLITLLGAWEWTQFVGQQSRPLALLPIVIVTALSFVVLPFDAQSLNSVGAGHIALLAIGSVWWLFASALALSYPKSAKFWSDSCPLRHVFGMLTLLPFLWSIVILRADSVLEQPYYGAKLVLFVCLIVWAADSGAYFAGRAFGKRKMAPHVSPNKTIEGLVGGIVTAFVVALLAAKGFELEFSSTSSMLMITLLTVIISVLGDLVESMFKRVAGIKDSSNLIPGHGGILDRVDSLTAAFPVFAFLYYVF